ncbi:MAG: hypothetical protein WBE47_19040 [Candidatus Acidiferrales bacterium]
MAKAKRQQAEPEYTVTLRIAGSKVKAMADAAKKIGVAVGKVTSSHPLDLTVHFNNIEFDSKQAHCFVEFEKSHDVKYQGARRSGSDVSFAGDNNNADDAGYEALLKEDKVVWTHTVREINGTVTVTVENGDGTMTEEQMVAALRTKLTATLKSLRLWDEKFVAEFDSLVKETADWHEEKKESRSRAARTGAAKRAKAKPAETAEPAKTPWNMEKQPRRSGKLRGKTNAFGTYRYKGTHTLLSKTITHCGIYYNGDDPKAQFYNTCETVAENPTCPACKWHLKRGALTYSAEPTKKTFNQVVDECGERESAFFDTLPDDMSVRGKNRLFKEHLEMSEPTQALAATVDGSDVPRICPDDEVL